MSESKLLSNIPFIGDGQPLLMGGRTFSSTIRRMRCDLPFTIPYGVPPVRISHTITANVYKSAFMLYGSPHRHSGAMYLMQRRRETMGFRGCYCCRERTISHILKATAGGDSPRRSRAGHFEHIDIRVFAFGDYPRQTKVEQLHCDVKQRWDNKCMYGFVIHDSEREVEGPFFVMRFPYHRLARRSRYSAASSPDR
jgi:hypothetical protein